MALPVLLAVDEDQDALRVVETQLVQRYSHDYRVECLGELGEALRRLAELAQTGGELALVLVGTSESGAVGGGLLEQVRALHPHAKRALLVPRGVWADKPSADAIHASIAFGGTDYYVVQAGGRA